MRLVLSYSTSFSVWGLSMGMGYPRRELQGQCVALLLCSWCIMVFKEIGRLYPVICSCEHSLVNLTGPEGQVEMPQLVQGIWWTSIWVQDDLESTWQSLPGVSGRPGLQGQGNLLQFCVSTSFPSLHPLDHAVPEGVVFIHSLELPRNVSLE